MMASVGVIAVTKGGAVHARRLAALLPESVLYLPRKWCAEETPINARLYDVALADLVSELLPQCRYLVFFAAVGLVVRVIAPCLKGKRSDPGILVIDEHARYVVSLLSGHAGGANQLTREVALLLGAEPVITTASDAQGVVALDLLGREEGWTLEGEAHLTEAMAALVNGAPLTIVQEAGATRWQTRWVMPANVTVFDSLAAYAQRHGKGDSGPVLMITDRVLSRQSPLCHRATTYRPKSLVVGVGCERGVSLEEVEAAIRNTLAQCGLAFSSIRNLATIDLKQTEVALMAFGEKYSLPIVSYSPAELRAVLTVSNPSTEVERAVGAPGVCEPAAMLSAHVACLVVPKQKCGRVTVAVARMAQGPGHVQGDSLQQGALYLVGIGPGSSEHMTVRARSVIQRAEVVVGYRLYLELVKELLVGKEVVPCELGEEWERATRAIEWAAHGQVVALLSSGDIGIYGMAGPVFEQLRLRGWERGDAPTVEVVPGITAASSCAAVLGAPLMHDFVAISLSDRLTPWSVIEARLAAAAHADFVIVLYNPRSERRQQPLLAAQQILLRHKASHTPVGVVTRCGRAGEQVRIATLGSFLTADIGMLTTVIIGNSQTLATEEFMVTPRGYNKSTRKSERSLESVS